MHGIMTCMFTFLCFRQDSMHVVGEQSHKTGATGAGKKSKRLARSRIPSKPVEMPGGVESLDLEVCSHLQILLSPILFSLPSSPFTLFSNKPSLLVWTAGHRFHWLRAGVQGHTHLSHAHYYFYRLHLSYRQNGNVL